MATEYDKLIKRLRAQAEAERFYDGEEMLYEIAADAIESTNKAYQMISEAYEAEVTKQNWIPVTERLPEDRQRVLAISLPKIRPRSSYYRLVYFSNNLESVDNLEFEGESRCGFFYYDSEYGFCEVDDVSHWMPLPEPPESGDK